jgi:hypothetical protein
MEQIKRAVTTVKKFVAQKGRFVCTISAILIFLFIAAVITAIVQCANKPGKKAKPFDEQFVPDSKFIKPGEDSLDENYYFSRISNEKWNEKEVNRWFTQPDTATIEELGRANDALVNEITGAAP